MAGFFYDLASGVKKISKTKNIEKIPKDLPVYLFSGENDPVGDNTRGVINVHNAYNKVGLKNLDIKFYKDGRHESLNEINRDEVFKDVINWIENHI